MPKFENLKENIKTDVLIIGGGAAGLLTAYKLKNAGVDYVLVEANQICRGVTAGTTAKITVGHGLIYNKLINTVGKEKAGLYLSANNNALNQYRNICDKIDCDFEEVDSYIYSINNRKKLEKEISALEILGCKSALVPTTTLPFSTVGAVKISNQAQFNPLKFFAALAKDLNIYENTRVLELKGLTAVTEKAKIKAKRIVVATHFPFLNKHGSYFLKLYQKRSYVSAFTGMPSVNGIFRDEKESGFSFRDYKGFVIIGGESKRTGAKSEGWNSIYRLAKEKYPAAEVKYNWAAQDCISLDHIPYIGNYSASTEDIYVATGFNKWGMTGSMAAADLLCNILSGNKNDYTKLFCPSRSILKCQTAVNAAETTINLLSFSKKRCPHLGCALKWNPYEHSWDCPCHGSRFSENGKLLNNPANNDAKF